MNTIAILGCGTMGRAVLGGLRATGRGVEGAPEVVAVSARRPATCQDLHVTYGLPALQDNAAAARLGDVALLTCKPQAAHELMASPGLRSALSGKLLISICAGVTTEQLSEWAPESAILRAMPNTPCLIGEGMTVVSPGPRANDAHVAFAERVFGAVGRVRILEEKHLDAVTGLSGSGPAFACVILEALADGGVRMGLPRDVAVELAAQTFQGASRMVLQTGKHPAALKDEVTTPAGCTIAGLLTMEDGKIRSVLARTIEEATRVASGLGKG